jgi:NADPH-dependent ferric siderophore reductase
MRIYTVRLARPFSREVDVDIVLHEHGGGPVARWAATAREGDEAILYGPDARYPDRHGGLEFHPPADTGAVLLAGDETAVPAICAILERLPVGHEGEAVMEVPGRDDFLPVETTGSVKVTWLARDDSGRGSLLVPAVQSVAGRLLPPLPAPDRFEDVEVDAEELWEVPEESPFGPLYAWLAGEAAVIRTLRRHLVAERGMDRRAVAFMGYWRLGRAEHNE